MSQKSQRRSRKQAARKGVVPVTHDPLDPSGSLLPQPTPSVALQQPTIRELEQRINFTESAGMLRLQTLREALDKSERLLEQRIDGLNQIREQIATLRSQFVTQEGMEVFQREYRVAHDALQKQFHSELETLQARHEADIKEVRTALEAQAKLMADVTGRMTLLIAAASVVGALLIFTLGLVIEQRLKLP